MKILHATSWISRWGGGVPPVVKGLARAQAARGNDVHVAALDDVHAAEDTQDWGVPVHLGSVTGPAALGTSCALRRFFKTHQNAFDVVHYHSLWMWPGYQCRRMAQAARIPLVITPHGMLEPWALKRSHWKKEIARRLFEDANLRSAACLHALCANEYESFRGFGLTNPVAVVPNGIDLTEFDCLPAAESITDRFPELRERRLALFLSRIHPKKGLPHLIEAWASLKNDFAEWTLLVVGPDQVGHTAAMKALAHAMGVQDRICFAGPLYGADRLAAMSAADFFVLPSFSEGFSMALLEAAACRLPLLLTPQCNFPEIVDAGGGIEVQPAAPDTARGLRDMMRLSEEERQSMGHKARRLVEDKYTWSSIAAEMDAVYTWLLGAGPMPGCVRRVDRDA
ncbi:MAG TPA: glycosyltransferase [Candidatus Hydrogenedentes bacterium]|nr:glycosyltransferase [Candidatus Hydrogenedentota bacterium]HOS01729.1 glycosyltransferase [Candidatus Hydrogenedentota bacterium]